MKAFDTLYVVEGVKVALLEAVGVFVDVLPFVTIVLLSDVVAVDGTVDVVEPLIEGENDEEMDELVVLLTLIVEERLDDALCEDVAEVLNETETEVV